MFVRVKFNDYSTLYYDYKYDLVEQPKINDIIVVHTRNGYSCAKIVDIIEESDKATDYVVCIVPYKEFEEKHNI